MPHSDHGDSTSSTIKVFPVKHEEGKKCNFGAEVWGIDLNHFSGALQSFYIHLKTTVLMLTDDQMRNSTSLKTPCINIRYSHSETRKKFCIQASSSSLPNGKFQFQFHFRGLPDNKSFDEKASGGFAHGDEPTYMVHNGIEFKGHVISTRSIPF